MSAVLCPNCNAALPPEEIGEGWCETCGKRIPSGLLTAVARSPGRVAPFPRRADGRVPDDGSVPCRLCGAEAPTRYVVFYQNIGMVFLRVHRTVEGHLCKPCIHRSFWEFTAITLFLGWWGVISLVMTPFLLLNNVARYVGCLGLKRGSDPWHVPGVRVRPHRGGTVLALGVLSLFCVAGFLLGPLAFLLARSDLRAMREGRMDRAGADTTRAGQICGVLGTILWLLALIAVLNPFSEHGHAPLPLARGRIIRSTDGKSQVRVPAGWSVKSGLNREATLQVADTDHHAFFIVLTESKRDFAESFTYRDHAHKTLEHMARGLADVTITGAPTELVVGGRPGVRYEVQGTLDHLRVVFLHTTVDGDESFHQVLAWTVPSRLESNRKTLEDIISSFAETN
jgi:hypothetical protein